MFNKKEVSVNTKTPRRNYSKLMLQMVLLVNDQVDAQLLYFILGLLQSSTCFEQRRAH